MENFQDESLIKRKKCDAVEVSIYARTPSSWSGTLNAYTGTLIMVVHFMLHTSVHVVARLTVGVCMVAEVIILASYLNKCLRLEVTFNLTGLYHAGKTVLLGCLMLCLSLCCYYVLPLIYHKVKYLSVDEILLICLPPIYLLAVSIPYCSTTCSDFYRIYLPNTLLAVLLGVYW